MKPFYRRNFDDYYYHNEKYQKIWFQIRTAKVFGFLIKFLMLMIN